MRSLIEAPDRESPQPGPSWPPDRWISPSALKSFNQCPYRVRLLYLDMIPEPKAFSLNLSKGLITHDLLAMSAWRIIGGQPDLGEEWFHEQAYRRLPRWEFPSDDARTGNAREIAHWVGRGLRYLDRTAAFMRIERGNHREWRRGPSGAPLTIVTRPDLVLRRIDRQGEPFIEFIDYKTGRQRTDAIAPVVMRYAFTEYFKSLVPDTQSLRMQFTWLWLDSGEIDITDLTLEYSMAAWGEVTRNIERLLTERVWPAQPSNGCNYCPYNGNACQAFREWDPESPDGW